MKNICLFSGGMDKGGGTERMTQLLANGLSSKGYNVFVLSKKAKEKTTFFPLNDNVYYSILDNKKYRGKISFIKNVFQLSSYIRRNKIDILIDVDVSLSVFTLPLKILNPKLKQIFWEHFYVKYNVDNVHMERIRKKCLTKGNAYVTLTPEDADILRDYKRNVIVQSIPNICVFDPKKYTYNKESKIIMSAGNFLYIKGFDIAINVAEIVLKKHEDWEWHFYGDGIERETLLKQAERTGLSNKIKFMGRVSNIEDAYGKASIYVLPSRSEGFGLVIAEAKAFHLPVVSFDVPYGPRNLIKDGENGFLIPMFDIDKMASSIDMLIENYDVRLEFSRKADIGLANLELDKVVNMWSELLEKI